MGAVGLLIEQMFLFAFPACALRVDLPAVGSPVSLLCCALLPVCMSELCWTLGGASGALQVVAQVPEAVQ